MIKRAVVTNQAAVGAYSQAVVAQGFVFVSGQIPLDPRTGALVESGDVRDHARRALQNVEAVLQAAGSSMAQVVKATIFLADIADYQAVNEVYARCFADGVKPARTAIQAGALPLGARVEIEVIAMASGGPGHE